MPPQTMNSTINFDEYPSVMPLVISLTVCLQILVPCLLGCCTGCVSLIRSVGDFERPLNYYEQLRKKERQQFEEDQEKRLQKAASAKNQEDLDQAVQEYQQAVLDYEEKIVREEKKIRRNSSHLSVRRACFYVHVFLFLSVAFFPCWL